MKAKGQRDANEAPAKVRCQEKSILFNFCFVSSIGQHFFSRLCVVGAALEPISKRLWIDYLNLGSVNEYLGT